MENVNLNMPKSIKNLSSVFGWIKGKMQTSMTGTVPEPSSAEEFKRYPQIMTGASIGRILVERGLIKPGQLLEALGKQREFEEKGRRKTVGALLIEMGCLSSNQYLEALSKHFDMPVISLFKFIPSPLVENSMADPYAFYNKVLVVAEYETEIKLAMAEPNPFILEELKKAFRGKKVHFFLANPLELEECFRVYRDPYARSFYR